MVFPLALLVLAAAPRPEVQLRLTPDRSAIEVVGLAPSVMADLKLRGPRGTDWPAKFQVVVKGEAARDSEPTPLLGDYSLTDDAVRFKPRFPLVPGVAYRATFRLLKWPVVAEFTIPKADAGRRTTISAVFPSADKLPENTLRLYIHFTRPMSRKDIYRHIKLVRDGGKRVDAPFLELDEQLWSEDGTRLTLLFDPGRVKRGLVPRLEEGPILEEGRHYTLTIDRDWEDVDGQKLLETFRKSFAVGPPDDEPVDPLRWSLMAPSKGSDAALILRLPKPLNRALLGRTVWVADEAGARVDGALTVGGGERVVAFAPARPWPAGAYRLVVDTRLEDICGNRVGEPFEVDELKPVTRNIVGKTVSRPFVVR